MQITDFLSINENDSVDEVKKKVEKLFERVAVLEEENAMFKSLFKVKDTKEKVPLRGYLVTDEEKRRIFAWRNVDKTYPGTLGLLLLQGDREVFVGYYKDGNYYSQETHDVITNKIDRWGYLEYLLCLPGESESLRRN